MPRQNGHSSTSCSWSDSGLRFGKLITLVCNLDPFAIDWDVTKVPFRLNPSVVTHNGHVEIRGCRRNRSGSADQRSTSGSRRHHVGRWPLADTSQRSDGRHSKGRWGPDSEVSSQYRWKDPDRLSAKKMLEVGVEIGLLRAAA